MVLGRSIMSPAKAGFSNQLCHRTHSWRCGLLIYRRLRRLGLHFDLVGLQPTAGGISWGRAGSLLFMHCALCVRQTRAQLRSQIAHVGFFDDVEVGAGDLVHFHAAAGQGAPAVNQIL